MLRKHPLAKCEDCPLAKERMAPTTGPRDATVALVSRSPGFHDVTNKRPFAGPSGDILDYLLKSNGVARSEIITTNVVLCYTEEPPQEAIAACSDRLDQDVENVTTLIAAGKESKEYFLGAGTIAKARGFSHNRTSSSGVSQRVVVTSNPAVVLRKAEVFPDMVRDFKLALNPKPAPKFPQTFLLNELKETLEHLDQWIEEWPDGLLVGSDLETFGFSADIACGGFAVDSDLAYVISWEMYQEDKVVERIKTLYERDLHWLWHNGKYDIKVLRRNGIKARIVEDTLLLSYACDERPGPEGIHELGYLLMEELGWPNYEPQSVKDFKKNNGWYDDPALVAGQQRDLYKYNGWDTAGMFQLFPILTAKAKNDVILAF